MSKEMFLQLFDYHWHTTFRLIDLAAKLGEAEYLGNENGGQRTPHALLVHLLQTDWAWRRALETGQQQSPLPLEGFPNLMAVLDGFQAEKSAWQIYLDGLSPESVVGEVILTTRRGHGVTFPRWRVLQHVVLHGMQHHSELARLLTGHGFSPGDIDFIFYSTSAS